MTKTKSSPSQSPTQGSREAGTQGSQGIQGNREAGTQGSQGSQWSPMENREHNGESQLFCQTLSLRIQEALNGDKYYELGRSPLFDFIRSIKAHSEICDLQPEAAFVRVTRELVHLFGGDIDPWIEGFELDADEAEILFVETWMDVKYLPGEGPLETALRLVKNGPVIVRGERPTPPLYAQFVAFIYHAQKLRGDKAIALPIRKVAEVLRGSARHKDMIWAMLNRAQREGLITKVKDSKFRSGEVGEAAEYRVNIEVMEVSL